MEASPVVGADVLERLESYVEPQVRAAGLHFARERVEPELVACRDAERIAQILLNLIGNAIKFTPAGGLIALRGALPALNAAPWSLQSVPIAGA